jgi:glutathione synthase/RimK-type ligase-like ATP-grasp enzyme
VILVCGIPSEPPLAFALRELRAIGAPHVVVNQRLTLDYSVEVEVKHGDVEGVLDLAGHPVALGEIGAVYARLMDDAALPELADDDPGSPRRRRVRRFHAALEEWFELTSALVITRAGPNASNGSKTYQAAICSENGFVVPETLVTNDPEAVLEFREKVGRVIYKSTSGLRSIVSELRDADLARLDAIRWCPVQFQQAVDGVDLRVHVVGEETFATTAVSDSIDYRYGETVLTPVELEADLAEHCVALARALDLPFAGIDLRVADDEAYCLEVNPSPAFSVYEAATGQPIARSLAGLLRRGTF